MNSELEKIIAALVRAHGIAKVERHLERLVPRSNWNAWQTVHTPSASPGKNAEPLKAKQTGLDD